MSEDPLNVNARETTNSLSEKTKVAEYQHYIFEGGKKIIDGDYVSAIKHFRNKEVAANMGFIFSMSRSRFTDKVDKSDVNSFSNTASMNSWFKDGGTISPSSVYISGIDIADKPQAQMSESELALAHEIALVHMEEFLHSLQKLRGGRPLAGYADSEVDVAAWMSKNNIPLTEAFLARYDRGLTLFGNEGEDDSLSERPAIRRGVFVNVERTNGDVQSNWQVAGFVTQNGDAIVRNFSEDVEKIIPVEELYPLNERGVRPFENISGFVDLFSKLDNLQTIQGSSSTYNSPELKRKINLVRKNEAQIDSIPRSGGLRLKVAEFLNLDQAGLDQRKTTNMNQN